MTSFLARVDDEGAPLLSFLLSSIFALVNENQGMESTVFEKNLSSLFAKPFARAISHTTKIFLWQVYLFKSLHTSSSVLVIENFVTWPHTCKKKIGRVTQAS